MANGRFAMHYSVAENLDDGGYSVLIELVRDGKVIKSAAKDGFRTYAEANAEKERLAALPMPGEMTH